MNTKTIVLLLALGITVLPGCNSPSSPNEKPKESSAVAGQLIPVKDMQEDLQILWGTIKEIHPGYGFYITTDSLQSLYHKTYAAIQTPLTESQFITAIYPFVSGLRCGHTQVKHSANYNRSAAPAVHLPFEVLVRHHRVWITTHSTDQLTTGAELINLNDVPVATIVDRGYELYSDDGYNETFKELFLGEYDGFEDVCNLYYHWPGPYQVKLRTPSGVVKTVKIDAAKGNAMAHAGPQKVDNFANWTTDNAIPDSRLRFLENASVALFQSPPFAYADTAVFKNAFRLIHQKGVQTLILDMRHNSGGDIRVATKLLSYLADTNFRIVKEVKSRLPDLARNSFSRYFDASVTEGFQLGFQSTRREGSWYRIEAKPAFGNLYGPFPVDKDDPFKGRLIVLIDGATFSSGALTAAAIKAQCKNAIFVGRETAGSEEGCNGVTLQRLTLPHTGIVVDFPWMRVISVAKQATRGRGIMPDYPVAYSPNDVVTQNDPDLKKALSLMEHL